MGPDSGGAVVKRRISGHYWTAGEYGKNQNDNETNKSGKH